jgi:hypothetical protein
MANVAAPRPTALMKSRLLVMFPLILNFSLTGVSLNGLSPRHAAGLSHRYDTVAIYSLPIISRYVELQARGRLVIL